MGLKLQVEPWLAFDDHTSCWHRKRKVCFGLAPLVIVTRLALLESWSSPYRARTIE